MTTDEITFQKYSLLPQAEKQKARAYIDRLFAIQKVKAPLPKYTRQQIIDRVQESIAQSERGETVSVEVAREEVRQLYGV